MMPSEDTEVELLKQMVDAGARDGLSKLNEMTVDG